MHCVRDNDHFVFATGGQASDKRLDNRVAAMCGQGRHEKGIAQMAPHLSDRSWTRMVKKLESKVAGIEFPHHTGFLTRRHSNLCGLSGQIDHGV